MKKARTQDRSMRSLHQYQVFDECSHSVTAALFVVGNASLRASALCLDRVHPAWRILVSDSEGQI